ncbi:sister chromatid cohesion protein DCC1 [Euwallacea fornicatus]|uniref:sister chromatid cohesion protein DCC1 n=1 Tax=Euwallacea fornicatus TaxID=995702 RepID=UPI00338E525F
MDNTTRTLEAANEVLGLAKLTRNELLPTSQALIFAPSNLHNNSYRLLELNKELLEAIENKEELVIKGCDNDDLVICSETSLFHVTCAETSNSLLLSKPVRFFESIKDNEQETLEVTTVCGIFQEYLEGNVMKSSFGHLSELLKHSLYRGPEFEGDVDKSKFYTLDQLKNIIQASNAEIVETLEGMDVFEINGFVRELDFEYHFRVLSYMLKLIDENSWSLDTIDYDETCEALQDLVPEEILSCLFKKYTNPSMIIEGAQLYKYKETKVCQFFAKVILRTAGKFNLEEFLQAWKESVPEGMVPTEEMLHGIAIINRKASPKVIWELEEVCLPDDINERFKVLFEAKEKWMVPEIAPYIKKLATSKLDVNALLAKHARASTVDGIKYYSAKHVK